MESVVCRSFDIVTSEIDGSIVMMSVSAGTFYGLNAVGSAIWQFVERPTTVATIITHISAEFEVSEAQCQDDILAFIEAMLDKKALIRAVQGGWDLKWVCQSRECFAVRSGCDVQN